LQTALQALYGHYEKTFKLWEEKGKVPRMLHRGPPEHRHLEGRLRLHLKRAEQSAGAVPTSRRRQHVTAQGAPRGEAKAITLREYPDTIAALSEVCTRQGFRTRLEFFRRAARHYLENLGEEATAAHFATALDGPADA
jgi:hypothetical protein